MNESITCALIQMNAGRHLEKNLEKACTMIYSAIVDYNADWVLLPEVFNLRGRTEDVVDNAHALPGVSLHPLMELARAHHIWILAGSLCEKTPSGQLFNTSCLINPMGRIQCRYRKKNLFKATLDGTVIDEAQTYSAGTQSKLTTVGPFNVGLSICYDLRFPELYRQYYKKGASILLVPSSFTTPTGRAHWEPLLRARAIENYSYVLAPNQVGTGAGGIETYGHSMIVDPWGRILACASEKNEEIVAASLCIDDIHSIRQHFT